MFLIHSIGYKAHHGIFISFGVPDLFHISIKAYWKDTKGNNEDLE
jgi:hypothetical protein